MASEYSYDQCKLTKLSELRILQIHPGVGDAQLVCEIRRLDDAKPYEALSWCWGTDPSTTIIHIEDNSRLYTFKVSVNLELGLRKLRYKDKRRLIWVDQICMNQSDIGERNAQVPLMANIYGRASNVCIWIGDGDEATDNAMDFITEEVLDLEHFGKIFDDSSAGNLVAFQSLMNRQWFSRRWVVQEITLARKATLRCGNKEIPWGDFADAVALCVDIEFSRQDLSNVIRKAQEFGNVSRYYENFAQLSAARLVEAANSIARRIRESPGPSEEPSEEIERLLSLEYLVSTLSSFESKNARDTIFALLSIAKDTTPQIEPYSTKDAHELPAAIRDQIRDWGSRKILSRNYVVKYEKSELEVWKDFIVFTVRKAEPTRCLDILCRPWVPAPKNKEGQVIPKKRNGLPSWIPTTDGGTFKISKNRANIGNRMERANADALVGLPEYDRGNYRAAGTRTIGPGFKFENHQALEQVLRSQTTGDFAYNRMSVKLAPNDYYESLSVDGFQLDNIKELGERSQAGTIPSDWLEIGNWPNRSDPPPDEFWRTLVANRRPDGRPASPLYPRMCGFALGQGLEDGDINTTELMNSHIHDNYVATEFLRRVQAVIWNRRMIKTDDGHLGLVPQDAKTGDMICILFGCSVPVVLREHKKTPRQIEVQSLGREAEVIQQAANMIQTAWTRKQMCKNLADHAAKQREADGKKPFSPPQSPKPVVKKAPVQDLGPLRVPPSPVFQELPADNTAAWAEIKQTKMMKPTCDHCGQEWDDKAFHRSGKRNEHHSARTDESTSKMARDDDASKSKFFHHDKPSEQWYEFIGPAYLHGMMNGEASIIQAKKLALDTKSFAKSRIFELR